jgi:hypothetical protein
MARGQGIIVATIVLVRLALAFGALSFLLGVIGFTVAAIGVSTNTVDRVDLPVFPFGPDTTLVSRKVVPQEVPSVRTSSRFSLEV